MLYTILYHVEVKNTIISQNAACLENSHSINQCFNSHLKQTLGVKGAYNKGTYNNKAE